MAKNGSNWFWRHKVLSGVGVMVLIGVVLGGQDAETSDASTRPEQSTTSAPTTPTPPATPTPSTPPTETDAPEEGELSEEGDEPEAPDVTQPSPSDPQPEKPRGRTYLVTRVIDGDTVELANGAAVRFVGIDTPERGDCGYEAATRNMERLVLGKHVRLTLSGEDTDRYGRLLRYVDVGKRDAGLAQIKAGLAIARYDSRDGYGYHEREKRYIAVDKATPSKTKCVNPEPAPAAPAPAESTYFENCTAARDAGAAPVHRGDPGYGSHLDRDGDGVACE